MKNGSLQQFSSATVRTLALLAVVMGVLLGFAVYWDGMGVSDQELLANHAKALDFWEGFREENSWPWWSDRFLGGTSLAPQWGTVLSTLWVLMWSSVWGVVTGGKLAILSAVAVGAVTLFWFLRSWIGSSATAMIGALWYCFSAGMWLRVVEVEHLVYVCALAVLPLVLLAVLRLARNPTVANALLVGAAGALLLLVYSKAALLCFPALLVFWLATSLRAGTLREQFTPPILLATGASVFLLGILPLLPSLRETSAMILFQLGPFEGWRQVFSSKSLMQLLDREGWLTTGFPETFASPKVRGGYFLGSAALLAIAGFVWFRKKIALEKQETAILRGSVLLALFCFWISAGPESLFLRHWETLGASVGGMDWTVIPIWLSLIAAVLLILFCIPGSGPMQVFLVVAAALVFLFVPGFFFATLLPGNELMRAPFDFYLIPALPFLAAAIGIVFCGVWAALRTFPLRLAFGAGAVVLLLWDLTGFASAARDRSVGEDVWKNFADAAKQMDTQAPKGSILALSGRYYYLQLPHMTERNLSTEAFQMYLQQEGMAALQAAAFSAGDGAPDAFRLAGVSAVLLDLKGDDRIPELEEAFEKRGTLLEANEDFRIIMLDEVLAPGFVAREVVQARNVGFADYPGILQLFSLRLLPVEVPVKNRLDGDYAGELRDGTLIIEENFARTGGSEWISLPPGDFVREKASRFVVRESPADGWLVLTRAWHPDWRAEINGTPAPVRRAFGALMAVEALEGAEVLWLFEPPAWYDAAIWISLLAWLGLPVALFLSRRSGLPGLPIHSQRNKLAKS